MKTKIIAEIGVNHNGSLDLAKKLIIEAKKSGADAVKFQTYITEEFVLKKTKKTKYQNKNMGTQISHFDMLKKYELKENQFKELVKVCKKNKIEFISTPYDLKSLSFLKKLKIKTIKISSADLKDYPLHEKAKKYNLNVIVSTGMSKYENIEDLIKIYKNNLKRLSLLHCTSNYPCSDESVNLRCIPEMLSRYKCKVGYSDHSNNIETAIASVALGANIIEKHFTLNNRMKGPDHIASFNPVNFKKMVDSIRLTERILGSKNKVIQKEELNMQKISCKSITVIKQLNRGEKITPDHIKMMRPGLGLDGTFFKKVLLRKVKKNIRPFTQIKLNDLVK